ncbi:MAG: hypothetical protein CL491_00920 [Acinetobacter sp.]|uniref:hypothetical protein n=1 Tax=Acinetobacter sp. TaxID=472 RepID=UPI000C55D042|nr:hypothetical protein [Acinetobacter sp.]MBT48653.1 hypothetical protein [Acinetobacter sp.]|tara:strand:- start:5982 stop:7043 length:1062 start_codon:yes stop_codon:yes gene_type:complete
MRDEPASKRSFDDVKNAQKDAGEWNENQVLFGIAKFGWLSMTQLAKFCDASHGSMRHIARRLEQTKYIWSEPLDNSPNVRCYALTRKGTARVKSVFTNTDFKKVETYSQCRGFLSQFEHHYHRHLSNEFLIDLVTDNINFQNYHITHYLPEHEVQARKNDINTMIQCVPDALALSDDNRLIAIEIENTLRGKSRHGTNLTHWIEVVAEKIENQGGASDSLRGLFGNLENPDYEDVDQVFVCASEQIFRNVWNKVQRILLKTDCLSAGDNISYFVVDGKRWHNIFENHELLSHSDPDVAERVSAGADRFTFPKAKRMQVVNELYSLNLSRKAVAQRHNISVSTLDRWKREFHAV